jgi:hypothetical protein
VNTLRKIYGKIFWQRTPELIVTDVLHQPNETSLNQLRRDHETIRSSSIAISDQGVRDALV